MGKDTSEKLVEQAQRIEWLDEEVTYLNQELQVLEPMLAARIKRVAELEAKFNKLAELAAAMYTQTQSWSPAFREYREWVSEHGDEG